MSAEKDFEFIKVKHLAVTEAQIQKCRKPWQRPSSGEDKIVITYKKSSVIKIPESFHDIEEVPGLVLLNVELEKEHPFNEKFKPIFSEWAGIFEYFQGSAHGVNIANIYLKQNETM